ncbi:MAG: hypothetical protein DHS80DRAFT_31724 [Piptocephalis tieghemiana]|nr:MAG: hypothetical protein DHS80DRAFT_31724 [Piptocephalis tieghemiana]
MSPLLLRGLCLGLFIQLPSYHLASPTLTTFLQPSPTIQTLYTASSPEVPFATYPALTEIIPITRYLQSTPSPSQPDETLLPTITLTPSSTETDPSDPSPSPIPLKAPDQPLLITPKRFPLTANHSTEHRLLYTPSWEVMNQANSSAPPLTPILDLGRDARDQPLTLVTGSWFSLELISRPGTYLGLTNSSTSPLSSISSSIPSLSSMNGIISEFRQSFHPRLIQLPSLLSLPQPDPNKYPGVAIQLDSPRVFSLPLSTEKKKKKKKKKGMIEEEAVLETFLRASNHHYLRWSNATQLSLFLSSPPPSPLHPTLPLEGLTLTPDPDQASLFRFAYPHDPSSSSSSPGRVSLLLKGRSIPLRLRSLPQLHGKGISEELVGTQAFHVSSPLRHKHVLTELMLQNPSSLPQTMSYQLDLTRKVTTSIHWFNTLQLTTVLSTRLAALLFSPGLDAVFQLSVSHNKKDDLLLQANRMVKADILVRPKSSLRARILSVESSYTAQVDAILSRTLLDPRTGESYADSDGRMGPEGPRPPAYYSIQGQMSVSVDGAAEVHVGQESPLSASK